MGTLILIILTALSSVIFYIWDTYKHRKLLIKANSQNHWNDRIIIEEKNENIKEEYPALYRVTKGFLKSNIRFNSKEILKNTKPINGNAKGDLQAEFSKIVKNKDEEAYQVMAWYMYACFQIDLLNTNKLEAVNDEANRIKKGNLEDFENKDVFCFI
ncbi:hypothetical protein [Lactococcus garvieae]|uniref:Uncharacterized protein n=1 Tax=Lactococcus garvieae TaxID=1363 RepID=A0A1I4H9V5_9LACT|nr:hypothetical protein [Lactococcus garvieae]SFL38453.1 hypothetical protein SAMN05216438_10785 [Lactococcus garvieae]